MRKTSWGSSHRMKEPISLPIAWAIAAIGWIVFLVIVGRAIVLALR